MKALTIIMVMLASVLGPIGTLAQDTRKLFRFYEDNDFINITGHGTDNSYTNGTRLDYFYQRPHNSRKFINKIVPHAGPESDNVYGWSLTQLMFTPNDLKTTAFQPRDYRYAGALFATHSIYSYNSIKKFAFQTEWIVGIRGRAAFAEQTQRAMHAAIHYQRPMGWGHQLKTQPLININVTYEKNLLSVSNFLEINVGVKSSIGSLTDAVAIYPMIRIGKMSPYFNGYLNQFGSFTRHGRKVKKQYYLFFKPSNTFVLYNALLKGTMENSASDSEGGRIKLSPAHRVLDLQTGVVIGLGNFSISYIQTYSSTYDHGLYSHSVGTLALYFELP